MKDGYIKVAAATPKVRVADCPYNTKLILDEMEDAKDKEVQILVFSELTISSYTCGDLFLQGPLLRDAKKGLLEITKATKGNSMIVVVGVPYIVHQKLYNCAAVIQDGNIMGLIPKTHLPNYNEFYEARHFARGKKKVEIIMIGDQMVPFGTNILFECEDIPELVIACEICEDLWVPLPPSTKHAMAGATIICNTSASDETTTKENYRRNLVSNQSARLVSGYIYANAGEGESTQDVVYSGHNLICENGTVLAEAKRFTNETIYAQIDLQRLSSERRRMTTFLDESEEEYFRIRFYMDIKETPLERNYPKTPFIPSDRKERDKRCDEILTIQAMGLKKRLEHTRCQHAVIGISGGLDSTLAVLVTARAFDMLGIPRSNMVCVTMPCYGTTDRTYQNAITLMKRLGANLKEINIIQAVEQHFKDIEHNADNHNVVYENSQARERTQILMDLANKYNGMVIGTGDLSELALGWATYNGDHMSMYAVNSSVPKTLVRYLVLYYAETTKDQALKEVLLDVLDTPVSPELLPPVDGVISQKTEDLVGPYELHDFFLYYMMRFGFTPKKLFRMAQKTFEDEYDIATIYKWLRTFIWRFFAQHFKRTCLPDGPKVGSVAVSPRGDLRMPTDASVNLWIQELEELKEELGLE